MSEGELINAAFAGNLAEVRRLVNRGVSANAKDRDGSTVLVAAAGSGYLEVAKFLVENGADVNAQNKDGWTALMGAAGSGYLEVAKFLLENGADVNAQNKDGSTVLVAAAGSGCLEVAKFLVENGADVNAAGGYSEVLRTHLKQVTLERLERQRLERERLQRERQEREPQLRQQLQLLSGSASGLVAAVTCLTAAAPVALDALTALTNARAVITRAANFRTLQRTVEETRTQVCTQDRKLSDVLRNIRSQLSSNNSDDKLTEHVQTKEATWKALYELREKFVQQLQALLTLELQVGNSDAELAKHRHAIQSHASAVSVKLGITGSIDAPSDPKQFGELMDKLQQAANDLQDSLSLKWLPVLVPLHETRSYFEELEKKTFSWKTLKDNLLDVMKHLQSQEDLQDKFTQIEPEFKTSLAQFVLQVNACFTTLSEAAIASSSDSTARRLSHAQNQLQLMRDANSLVEAFGPILARKQKADRLARSTKRELAMLSASIQYCDDSSELPKLQTKQKSLEAILKQLQSEQQNDAKWFKEHERALLEFAPEKVHAYSRNSPSSSINVGIELDETASLSDFEMLQTIVPGKVYRMKHSEDEEECVVKRLIGNREVRKEALRLAKLKHPLIVPITRLVADPSSPDVVFMQMPFFDKGNLRGWVQRMQVFAQQNGGDFTRAGSGTSAPFLEIQTTFRQIAQALAHVHSHGVIHRDLKPENVLLSSRGNIALCDFGISSEVGSDPSFLTTLTTSTAVAGTRGYMAPETHDRTWKQHPMAVDMWALGCMMLELLIPNSAQLEEQVRNAQQWPQLEARFRESPAMMAYVRLCRHLLSPNAQERPTVHEVLLSDALVVQYSSTVEKLDPIARIGSLLQSVRKRASDNGPASGKLVRIALPPLTDKVAVCRVLFDQLQEGKDFQSVYQKLQFRSASDGSEHVLSEVMQVFFEVIALPGQALFTHLLTDATPPTAIPMSVALVPLPQANETNLKTVGRLLAKCLLEGIHVPLLLNSSCLDVMLGQRDQRPNFTTGAPVDEWVATLSETSDEDATQMRNLLRPRLDVAEYVVEAGALLGTDSTERVTDSNKAAIVTEACWNRLVGTRRSALMALRDGFQLLRLSGNGAMVITGTELQMVLLGTDCISLKMLRECFHFTAEAWQSPQELNKARDLLMTWIENASKFARRVFVLHCFGTLLVFQKDQPSPHVFVIPSTDDFFHFEANGNNVLAVPTNCPSIESFELRLYKELGATAIAKSSAQKHRELTQDELDSVMNSMRGEIRAGGWYICPNGHIYAIGECGGAMQRARCPECKAEIGGEQHRLVGGNRHAAVDGSAAPAWPQ